MQKQKKKKKKYGKPKITRIKLDAKTAVLATCKTAHSTGGPEHPHCGPGPFPCLDDGS